MAMVRDWVLLQDESRPGDQLLSGGTIEPGRVLTRVGVVEVPKTIVEYLGGKSMKINVKAFALAAGLWWGIGLFALTWWMILFRGSAGDPTLIGRVYLGYSVTPIGSLVGLGWGFVDGLVGGAILAWLYNWASSHFFRAEQA